MNTPIGQQFLAVGTLFMALLLLASIGFLIGGIILIVQKQRVFGIVAIVASFFTFVVGLASPGLANWIRVSLEDADLISHSKSQPNVNQKVTDELSRKKGESIDS